MAEASTFAAARAAMAALRIPVDATVRSGGLASTGRRKAAVAGAAKRQRELTPTFSAGSCAVC